MTVIQSYLQGSRHKLKNQPCQDRTFSMSENGVDVIALADGAGNVKYTHSAHGAECVTEVISKFLCRNFDKFYEDDDLEKLANVVTVVCHRALKNLADSLGLDSIKVLSSTLLVVAVKDEKVVICHIGDGVIGKLTPEGAKVVSAPDNGEFVSTTYFITNPAASKHMRILKEDVGNTISYFLMSDGTAEFIYDEENKVFRNAARKMASLVLKEDGQEQLERTISKYMIDEDAYSDDCSFACLLVKKRELIAPIAVESKEEFAAVTDCVSAAPAYALDEKSSCAIERTDKNKTAKNNTQIAKFGIVLAVMFLIFILTALLNKSDFGENEKKTGKKTVETSMSSVDKSSEQDSDENERSTRFSMSIFSTTGTVTDKSIQSTQNSKPENTTNATVKDNVANKDNDVIKVSVTTKVTGTIKDETTAK